MELKEYQQRCINKIREYLEILSSEKSTYLKNKALIPDLKDDYVSRVWEKAGGFIHAPRKNGIGEYLPNFCLKVPTGGGKTILATHTIDLVQRFLLKRRNGFVLWIVPTTQIYNQTLKSLRNREHPYRQVLDLSSGGKTAILEKGDSFSPTDVDESLIIMLLMLPSANRENKETLKLFQDSGGYEAFFPQEDNLKAHAELLEKIPNLDFFGDKIWGRQVKTSLGNTLRILQPAIIIDEGQKAYSPQAQNTINNFNPTLIVELSATPPPAANKLVDIKGQELNREQMIKLDINVTNKSDTNWQLTLKESVLKRDALEEKARDYRNETGVYIRPINLIQVERTGKDQREGRFIHAEDVREFLITDCTVPPECIAIKSTDKDELLDIDLYDKSCPIRFIITKQALQEGWDCSFAYILTMLTNASSETGITQLVGRVLRQPYAKKTGITALDECYVYCFQQKTGNLLKSIKSGLESEGLGDVAGYVVQDDDNGKSAEYEIVSYRERFKKYEGHIYLPRFIIQENGGWRDLRYEMDLLSRIDWDQLDISAIGNLSLSQTNFHDEVTALTLSQDIQRVIEKKGVQATDAIVKLDIIFVTRQVTEIIPNPWRAYNIACKAVDLLKQRYSDAIIAANLVFITEELLKIIRTQTDTLAEEVFRNLIHQKQLCFFLQKGTGFMLPKNIKVTKSNILFNSNKGEPIARSLFDKVDKTELNNLEESVAICMDEQSRLLFWYRNISRADYFIQGWKKHKIYADFIAAKSDTTDELGKVFVVETKGMHLKNEDTAYKESIFKLCNDLGKEKQWNELELEFSQREIEFQVIYDDEWKRKLNEIFA